MSWTLVPAIAFASSWALYAWFDPRLDWRARTLRLLVGWAAFSLLVAEILSQASLLTTGVARIFWLAITLTSIIALLLFQHRHQRQPLPLPNRPRGWEWPTLGLLSASLLTTATVAWHAPPQTWDSLIYRMSRVAHWVQQASLRHFPTGIAIQNSRPPGAELLLLQSFMLVGSDRLANFISWGALAGAVIGASLLADQLGANRSSQWLAAGVAASIPMGVVQASSTMNDGVVGLWVVIVASESLRIYHEGWNTGSALALSLALSLGVSTKPTAFPYVLPFAAWAGWVAFRRGSGRDTLKLLGLALSLIILLNFGWVSRNFDTFGAPMNPNEVSLHGGMPRAPRFLLSNLIRHAALHAATPSPHANKGVELAVLWLHDLLGVDPNDPRMTSAGEFRIRAPDRHEDSVPNPLQAALFLISLAVLFKWRKAYPAQTTQYVGLCLLTFILFSATFKWQIFASRYHLPFFLITSPIIALAFGRLLNSKPWAISTMLAFLVGLAAPWLVSIHSRPLVAVQGESYVDSVLVEPRTRLYFANGTYLYAPLTSIIGAILEEECDQVGLMLGGNHPEYLIWAAAGAPRTDWRLEWIVSGTASSRYADPTFKPCAVVCTTCSADQIQIRGLERRLERAGFALYLEPSR